MNRYSLLIKAENLLLTNARNFGLSSALAMRRPPKEEFENNGMHTRKRTADPFDRRWTWTAKRAEPYNIRGGHMDWTKMTITHRGVQRPGYLDPKTKDFVYVNDMVAEIVVPDLTGFNLKPYVSHNAPDIETPVFDAKQLFEKTLQQDIIDSHNKKNEAKSENQ